MLKIKNEYSTSTVQLKIGNKTVMFNGAGSYTQEQLQKLKESEFFSHFITEVDNDTTEVLERVIEFKEYPVIEMGKLQKMSNGKLKETYPFAHGETKAQIIAHILECKYGNV